MKGRKEGRSAGKYRAGAAFAAVAAALGAGKAAVAAQIVNQKKLVVERLRSLPAEDGTYTLLAATDPANPYGASLPWPKLESGRRPSRTAGAHLLMRDGEPVVYVERGGKGLRRLADLDPGDMGDAMTALAEAVEAGTLPKLAVERIDGEPVIGSGFEEVLVTAGFSRGPKRLVAAGAR